MTASNVCSSSTIARAHRRPRVGRQDLEVDSAPDARARHLAESAGSRWSKLRSVESDAQRDVDRRQSLTIQVGQRKRPPLQPAFGSGLRVDVRAWLERGLEMHPDLRRWFGRLTRYDERHELHQRLDRRATSTRLPLGPLVGQPPALPLMDLGVAGQRSPTDRLTRRAIELLAVVMGQQYRCSEPVGEGSRTKRPTRLLSIHHPADHPRLDVTSDERGLLTGGKHTQPVSDGC